MTEKMKLYYYKEHGICVSCGQYDAVPGKTMCEVCAAKKYENAIRYRPSPEQKKRSAEHVMRKRDERRAAGLCIQCGKPQAEKSSSYCTVCLYKKREYARKSRVKKKGHGIPRSELPAYGICYLCADNPVEDGRPTCAKCHERLAENARNARESIDYSHHIWREL